MFLKSVMLAAAIAMAVPAFAQEAMAIAADICIYTNPNLTIEEL